MRRTGGPWRGRVCGAGGIDGAATRSIGACYNPGTPAHRGMGLRFRSVPGNADGFFGRARPCPNGCDGPGGSLALALPARGVTLSGLVDSLGFAGHGSDARSTHSVFSSFSSSGRLNLGEDGSWSEDFCRSEDGSVWGPCWPWSRFRDAALRPPRPEAVPRRLRSRRRNRSPRRSPTSYPRKRNPVHKLRATGCSRTPRS